MNVEELAEKFMKLFQGYRGAYGTYIVQDKYSLKKKGRGLTKKEPVTKELWLAHLQGTINSGIGIVPINEDAECYWGAIDIDMYENFDVNEFARTVADTSLVICRSKSGGAHCFLFVEEAIPARQMQTKLREVAASLGYSGSEIFPKQVQRKSEGDIGNWLNMPYFNYSEPTRYCLDETGHPLSAEDFLAYAFKKQLKNAAATDKVSATVAKDVTFDQLFAEGAPCHEALYRRGIRETEDGRNNCLYTIGQQFKRQRPEDWEQLLTEFNQKYCAPPLAFAEVVQICNSIKKGDGFYKCKDVCCSENCDKELCLSRKYGVGDGENAMPNFTGIQKMGGNRDCLWFLTLDSNESVELTTEELFSPAKVRQRVAEALEAPLLLPEISAKDWRKILIKLMDNACEIIDDVTTNEDMFYDYLYDFCTQQRTGRILADVLEGRPYNENGLVWFKLSDFKAFLDEKKYPRCTAQAISAKLRTRYIDGKQQEYCQYYKNKRITANGTETRVNLWCVPLSDERSEVNVLPADLAPVNFDYTAEEDDLFAGVDLE